MGGEFMTMHLINLATDILKLDDDQLAELNLLVDMMQNEVVNNKNNKIISLEDYKNEKGL